MSNRTIKGTTVLCMKESGQPAENQQIPLADSERWRGSQVGKGWTRSQNRRTSSFIPSREPFNLSLPNSNDSDSKTGSSKSNWF